MGSRYQFTDRKRRIIFNLTDDLCWYCGKEASTIDHMQPRSKGGNNRYGNLVPCCDECNQRKADHNVEQYRQQLTNVAMSRIRFANKEARKLFITEFRFYGEIHHIDPFLPARLAKWKGFPDTVSIIHIHHLSMTHQWRVRGLRWLLGNKRYKRLKSFLKAHLPFWLYLVLLGESDDFPKESLTASMSLPNSTSSKPGSIRYGMD